MKKLFIIFWASGILATIAGVPYILELQKEVLKEAPIPLPVIGLMIVVQTAVILAIAVYIGLKLSAKAGLSLNIPQAKVKLSEYLPPILKVAIPAGTIAAILIKLGDTLFTQYTPALSAPSATPAIWQTILAALYGGVVEELLMRLFFVSLFVWLLSKAFKQTLPHNNKAVFWSAIVLAAVLFGIGHLPATAALTAITPVVVLRAIILNGIGGLIFGWLFWRKGLLYAIAVHFVTDIVLLVIIPLILRAA